MKMKPKIRFKGFDDAYYENKFSQLFNTISDSGHNVSSNEYCKRGTYPVIDQSKDYIVGYTDVVAPIIPKGGIIVFGDHTRELKYVDFPFCTGADGTQLLSPKSKDIPMYLYYYCKSLKIPNTGYNRHFKYIKETIYNIPLSTKEQQVIASFFDNLDSQISASASRIASLKQIKAASLQAMFPLEGETVPKVRFKGFKGEWKKVKLEEIAVFSKGQGYSKSDLKEEGYPIVLYGRMYTKYQFSINEVDTFVNPKDFSIISEGNEVIMPASGETPEDIARASAVIVKNIILGGDLNIMRFDLTNYSTPFIALTITYGKTHYDLSRCAQGKSVVHLHNGEISKATIMLPSLEEQQVITSYFTSLDRQISLHSQRLEKLKQIKAACLDKMFV